MWEKGAGRAGESNRGKMGTMVIEQKFKKGKKGKWSDFFACTCPVFPMPFIEKTVFTQLHILASFVID